VTKHVPEPTNRVPRKKKTIAPVSHLNFGYDYAGRVKTMKTWQNFASGSGAAVTTWNYSVARGWLSGKRYEDAGQGSLGPDYTYTPGGRLKTRTWARGVVTTYGYGFDDANSGNDYPELVQVDYTNAPQATPSISYTYDRAGRQATIAQNPTTTTLTYNLAGEPVQESYSGGPLNGLSVTNGYDHWMRRTNVVLRSASASLHSAGYSYDEASRLRAVLSGQVSATYSYLANSPLVSQIAFTNNGVQRMVTSKQYDLLNRLENIKSVPAASAAVSFDYTYNLANQRTLRRETDASYWRYEYDSLGQVVSGKKYWADGSPVAGQQFQYAFDDIGNRLATKAGGDEFGANLRTNAYYPNLLNQYTSRTVPGAADIIGVSLATSTVTVNSLVPYRKGEYFRKELTVANSSAPVWTNITVAANGQTSVSANVLVPKANESFWHDADGNLLSDSLWTNTWNGENRLVVLESAAGMPTGAKMREQWNHLPDGRWIERIVSTNNGSAYYPAYTNRFVWDGQVLLAILDHTNGLVMSFIHGLDLSGSIQGAGGVGGVVVVVFKTNGTHFVSYDGNGNVAGLTDSGSGTNSAIYEYGPFSEPIRVTGVLANQMPLRFSTMYEDNVTGDRKYLFRDYAPSTGRWKSRDPLEEKGGKNLYGFVNDEPVTKLDALGRNITDLFLKLHGRQIPKAIGVNAGGLLAIKLPWLTGSIAGTWLHSFLLGVGAGIYFFPDSCEVGVYSIRAGLGNNLVDWRPISDFDFGQNYEMGLIASIGASVETAVYYGNSTPGFANADSFVGLFHTIYIDTGAFSLGVYIGKPDASTGGNWVGGTFGVGAGLGFAVVDWNYQYMVKPSTKFILPQCACYAAIAAMP